MTATSFPNGILSQGVPIPSSGNGAPPRLGPYLYVNTVTGSDGGDGTASAPWQTMGRAFTYLSGQGSLANNAIIGFTGTIREQLTAPLGVSGVTIAGIQGGGVRDDNGAKWTYPASGAVAGGALLELREQGWVLSNFLMTPEPTSGACVKLHRQENATYPDASHAQFYNMRFVGIDVTTTYGLQDVGGCSAIQAIGCEFYLLTTGLYSSSQSIATPLRWQVLGNRFLQNTNDIIVPSSYCLYQGNRHMTDTTVIINIASGGNNMVTGNVFPNGNADIDPAHGYDGNATDVWTGNLVTDQAAYVYGDPA